MQPSPTPEEARLLELRHAATWGWPSSTSRLYRADTSAARSDIMPPELTEHRGPDHRGVIRPCVQDWHRCYDGPTADDAPEATR